MNAVIVEDSRLARQELKRLLEAIPDLTLAGEAANAAEALEIIPRLAPDLLFLDIQLPGQDGFEILQQLDDAPDVIFVTAFDEYALKAFEFNALDYLQKPVQPERLLAAIEKVRRRRAANGGPLTDSSQVFVKDGERCWFVKLAQVRLLQIVGSYTQLFFEDHKPTLPKSLNLLESRLDPKIFFRANRQQIINLKWIETVEPWFSGNLKITLKSGEEIEVSRRQAARFKELLSL